MQSNRKAVHRFVTRTSMVLLEQKLTSGNMRIFASLLAIQLSSSCRMARNDGVEEHQQKLPNVHRATDAGCNPAFIELSLPVVGARSVMMHFRYRHRIG
jgi:hypothetical protein